MKKNIFLLVAGICTGAFLLSAMQAPAQGVLPVHRYVVPKLLLNKAGNASSFAYSLRKIRTGYNGYAVRIRIGSVLSIAEADVAFDDNHIVSADSDVSVVTAGLLSGFTVGQVVPLSSFKGLQSAFVKTWYDQGVTAYNATQNTDSLQPELVLNSAGASNSKPSVLFNGGTYLNVGQPIQNIVKNGINGSFLLWTKPTANANQESFGYWAATGLAFRWALHFNWSDGKLYFDAGEVCCAGARSFTNSTNLNIFKQYSFIRGTSYKTVRINSTATTLNNSSASSTSASGGSFYIGWAVNGINSKYKGSVCEAVMFPVDFAISSLQILETDQFNFWSN